MPLSLTDLQTELTIDAVRAQLLTLLSEEGFPVEAWQETGNARILIEAYSALVVEQSKSIALLARMPFLETAEGQYLDSLVKSHYELARLAAIASTFDVVLDNTGLTTYPITIGQIVLRSSSGATFSNTAAGTLIAGAETTLAFRADIPGASGNIPGQTLELVTPFAGVVATFSGAFTSLGSDAESDASLRARARTQWGALRIERASDGVLALARDAAPAVTQVVVDSDAPRGPGTVDVYLAGDGATAGSGDVTAVQTALDAAFFGNVVGATDPLVKAIAAPTTTLAVTATCYVRGLEASSAQTDLETAVDEFIESIPIGGFDLSPGPTHIVQRGQLLNAMLDLDGVVSADVTAPAGDLVVAENTKVLAGTISITVVRMAS